MGLFGSLFANTKGESVALIDIAPDSVGGAYLHLPPEGPPTLLYSKRIALQDPGSPSPVQVGKTLQVLGQSLLTEGSALLVRALGRGHVGSILVSIDAPWQQTSVRSEKIEREKPFTFSRSVLDAALKRAAEEPPERVLADQSVVGTVLDGYETNRPLGRRATYVNIITLTSSIDRALAKTVHDEIRKIFHREEVRLIAAPSLRYQAVRALFPHEEDYLLIDSAGKTLVTSLIRRRLLVAVEQTIVGESAEQGIDPWTAAMKRTLSEITKRFPLPRTMILIASDAERADLKSKLESNDLASLRLAQEPPAVVPVLSSHLSDRLKLAPEAGVDLPLSLLGAFITSRP